MSILILTGPYVIDNPERNVRRLIQRLRDKQQFQAGDTVLLPMQALNGTVDAFWLMRPENRERNDYWLKKLASGLKSTGVRLLIPVALTQGVGVLEMVGGQFRTLAIKPIDGGIYVEAEQTQIGMDVIFRAAAVGEPFAIPDSSDYVIVDGRGFDNGHVFLGQCRLVKKGRTRLSYLGEADLINLGEGHVCLQDVYHERFAAMQMALRCYLQNYGFERVTIGISGGLDSAVVAALAVSVVGADRVNAVVMPSCFTSQASKIDAQQLAQRLQLRLRSIDIMPAVQCIAQSVNPHLPYWANKDLMNENIQARVRGLLLMSISNADGSLVLNTGNKSELSVGYCTMYGDMVGGLAPLADIYKSDLYKLCENVAYLREMIPSNILTKAPSAELRENQKDEDSLPSYTELDAVLKDLIEGAMSGKRLRKKYGAEFANKICKMVSSSQFKHHQAPLAVCLTGRPICALTPEFFHGLLTQN